MEGKNTNTQTLLYRVAGFVLLAGIVSAVMIYLTAGKTPEGAYEGAEGYVYQILPENSKIYRYDLELYGGKANVLADDFRNWFAELWHGKSLAFTVACLGAFFSFVLFVVANNLSGNIKSDENSTDPAEKST